MIVGFETSSGSSHKLRHGVEVPISVAHVTVTQIAREDQSSAIDTLATGLPAPKHAAGVSVAKIVNPWRASLASKSPTQTRENRVHRAVSHGTSRFGCKEIFGQWEVFLTLLVIKAQWSERRWVQGNPTGLAELSLTHK
jgi:hypothetical protein